jgi:lysozyme family protein
MRQNWERSIKEVLRHEGGYVDHPADPGGATHFGVTLNTYRQYKGNPHLTADDLRNIPIGEVYDIYKTRYWDKVRGDQLPSGIDFLVFDFGVNAGVGRAAKMLQNLVGVPADGGIGPQTLRATSEVYEENPEQLIVAYTDARAEYYQSLPHFPTFGRGWLRRTKESEDIALSMLG